MPAILTRENEDRWLTPGSIKEQDRASMLAPCPDDILEAYPVSKAVNDPSREGPELIRRSGDRTLDL